MPLALPPILWQPLCIWSPFARIAMSPFLIIRFAIVTALLSTLSSVIGVAENWPQFRGPNADGIASQKCPVEWADTGAENKNVKWKIAVPGEGWSAPVVWGKQLLLTVAVPETSENSGSTGPAEYSGGGGRRRDDLTATVYRYEVVCLDPDSGQEIWRRTARKGRPPIPRHSSNTYATETPITDGSHVFAYFGMNGVYCYDMDGNLQWERDLGSYAMRAGWGTSSSPVLFDGKLFIQVDNDEQSFLVALDAKSGDETWRVNRDEKSQYSSPYVWKNRLRSELVCGGMIYRSYDPATGKLLWQLDMSKGRSSATPVSSGELLYVGTEFRNRGGADDGGGFVFAVKPGGSGDITPSDDENQTEFIAWKQARSGIQMASPTVCKGHLYFLERRTGSLHCVNAETGETAYRKRISGSRAFWASPWTDGERVFCLDSGGTTFVVAGGSDYQLIAKNPIDEQAWSTPAVAHNSLFLRTRDHLYRIAE